jgi:hypothetical protein
MKPLFLILLILNMLIGAVLLLNGPVWQTHEPGRMTMQVASDQFHLLSEADVAQLRQQAEAAAPPTPPPLACLVIGHFSSDSVARRVQARMSGLVGSGNVHRLDNGNDSQLQLSGLDPAHDSAVHKALEEYPRLSLTRCPAASGH